MDDPTDLRNFDIRVADDFDIVGTLGAAAAHEVHTGQTAATPGRARLFEVLDEAGRGLAGTARALAMSAKAEELLANRRPDDEASMARRDERKEALRRGAQLARDVDGLSDGSQERSE
ncbi:hypothetical protein A5722_01590 [Mycobacterium vulneris]|uniref:Uncharacterized protein n=1 Tax=Mycolicibacterium septicum DSM 44393 TaxID=1341646 RepID=A0A7X6MXY9_9MYCO|nr:MULTISPECIES: hypothetical protein [Mycolicibacterium]MBX8687864.1 hypothetical protein [Mycobacterium sp. 20091114027_K0903767]OCB48679.1 hypothetical protein A5721_04860 [Mycolicibacterium vulneris]NKZ15029.1 hypothetical protein [Mycolicibacterium septicum DSM 44393]OBK01904.1 hypothetical protein A5637_18360 [Mycolicibacterium fortuitum]OBK63335.1 hypothetical protein A5654_24430 [Mycolicibacterium fortuitum]